MLRELRSKAIPSKGYISGETLRAQDDPQNYVVITTWQSIEEWKAWEKNPERKKIQAKIEKWMARPTKTKIYSYAWRVLEVSIEGIAFTTDTKQFRTSHEIAMEWYLDNQRRVR